MIAHSGKLWNYDYLTASLMYVGQSYHNEYEPLS